MVKVEPGRRLDASRRIAAHFRPLPNVTSDDFFAQLTRSLAGPLATGAALSPGQSTSERWSSPWSSELSLGARSSSAASSSSLGAREHRKRRVRVYCQVRELDARSGRQLQRRKLTCVREETDEAEEADEAIELDMSSSSASLNLRPVEQLDEQLDFASFLRNQSSRGAPSSGRNQNSRPTAGNEQPIGCYELFCIHDAELLVHKNQAAIEAQLLAERLAKLLESIV